MVSTTASTARFFSSLRKVEVRSAARAVPRSGTKEEDQTTLAVTTEMVVVPLPRRPLLPGIHTSAYMENQPALRRALSCVGKGVLVAAFMLKDSKDYKGCILRPGLEGEEVFSRLHSVGTMAEVTAPEVGKTGRVPLFGHCRVRMAGFVRDNPLTVRVKGLQGTRYTYDQLKGYQKDMADEAFEAICALLPDDGYMPHLMGLVSLPDGIANFGPSILPVEDKALHQQALEELDGAKRLEICLQIAKRELDKTGRWAPKPDEEYTEEEKQALADMKLDKFGGSRYDLLPDQSQYMTGQSVFAPSMELRIKLAKLKNWLSLDTMAFLKEGHSTSRLGEYSRGY